MSVSKSKLVIPCIFIGQIVALVPSTKKILKRLLPITLPMAIPGFFLKAATMEVASSGRDLSHIHITEPTRQAALNSAV